MKGPVFELFNMKGMLRNLKQFEFRAKSQTADGEVISSRLIPFRDRVLVLDEH